MCLYVGICMWVWVSIELRDVGAPWTVVRDACEAPIMVVGNWIELLTTDPSLQTRSGLSKINKYNIYF